MLSVIILDNGESKVTELTYENLYHELKDIKGSELLIYKNWFTALKKVKNNYVCFVEADCLVSPGYFNTQLKALVKNPLRKVSMVSPAVGVNHWDNCFYGYKINVASNNNGIIPNREKKSRSQYPVQIGYIPGSIIRLNMLKTAVEAVRVEPSWNNDLVYLSAQLSLAFWKQGDGNPVHVYPNVTYVTTEEYVNDIAHFPVNLGNLFSKFAMESI